MVIAILGIIALIAIPRFAGIQQQARIDADKATARQIMNTARIIDSLADATAGTAVTSFSATTQPGNWNFGTPSTAYMYIPVPRTGGSFSLTYGGATAATAYIVSVNGTPAIQVIEGQ